MITDSQLRNISNIKQRLRATLTTWNEATHTDLDYFFRPLRKLNKKLYINGRGDE